MKRLNEYWPDSDGPRGFPLEWPPDHPRTDPERRRKSRYFVGMETICELKKELIRLGATHAILSTDFGLVNDKWKFLGDPGVAVYFVVNGRNVAISCDTYLRSDENRKALIEFIRVLRRCRRDGLEHLIDAAMFGLTMSLPAPNTWWGILGIGPNSSKREIRRAYHRCAKQHHPDLGGSKEKMAEVNKAYEEGMHLWEVKL